MDLKFREFAASEREDLADFMASEEWEYRSVPSVSRDEVIARVDSGFFSRKDTRTFWIIGGEDHKIGIIRLYDLGDGIDDDETPLFDIRIGCSFRGRGVGKQAVKWLTNHVFTTYRNKKRIEATVRQDNLAMRRVLLQCGYVKEAHYRAADEGQRYGTVGYAILKRDWVTGTTTPVDWHDEESLLE